MKFLFLLFLGFTLFSCGKKETAAPLKQTVSASELQVSPTGVALLQKLFNIYSPEGKLTLPQIKNIGHKLSPLLSPYLEQLALSAESSEKKYTAEEFFQYLGESNRTLLWATTYDLGTSEGWKKFIAVEFEDGDQGLQEEYLRLMKKVLEGAQTREKKEEYLKLALKIGVGFNVMEALEVSRGSVLDTLMRSTLYLHSKKDAPSLNENTERLLKILLVTQYAQLDSGAKPLEMDRTTAWCFSGMTKFLSANYPDLAVTKLARLYLDNTQLSFEKAKKNPEAAHRLVHPKAFEALGKPEAEELSVWRAYDAYELVKGICKEKKIALDLNSWNKLDYTSPNFCKEL
jgi:hypothetical protein